LGKNQNSYVTFWDEVNNSWISSVNLEWDILEKREDRIVLQGFSGDTKIVEKWRIGLKGDDVVFEVGIENKNDHKIRDLHWDFILSEAYEEYFINNNYLHLPEFSSRNEWQEILRVKESKCIGCTSNDKELPYIAMGKRDTDIIKVFNTGYESEKRVVSLWSNDPRMRFSLRFFDKRNLFEEFITSSFNDFLKDLQKQKEHFLKKYSISSGNLSLFINPESRSINLCYKDQQVTKASGLECSFKHKQKLLNTFYSSKFSPVKKDDSLIIDIHWKEASLKQEWKLYFKDKRLCWELTQYKDSKETIEDFKIGLTLSHEYKHFFCGSQEDNFPEEFTIWQDMAINTPLSELFGVRKTQELPAVALENIKGSSLVVQNGDSLLKCRALQIRLKDNAVNQAKLNISQKISLYEDETPILQYIQFQMQKQKEHFLKKYSISSGDLKLFADPVNKSINFYYKEQPLTKGYGLFLGLKIDSNPYSLSFCKEWNVIKESACTLKLIMTQERCAQQEIFIFRLDDKGLSIRVDLASQAEFHLETYYFKLEFSEEYKRWATFYEKSDFPSEAQAMDSIIPARMIENKAGSIILKPENEILPTLNIATSFNPSRRIVSLHKRRERQAETVCLQYQFSFFNDEADFRPGNHTIFEANILLGKKTLKAEKDVAPPIKLTTKGLKFIFDRGRGRLFWKDRELTKGLGAYSSMRVKGIWYDSSQAIWKLERKEQNRLVAYGKWLFLPIFQKWHIDIEKNKILWEVDTEVSEDVRPEIEQVNIMARDAYDKWALSNGTEGCFENVYTDDYDILPFRYYYMALKQPVINIKGSKLAPLSFGCIREDGFKALIENSDYFYKARMIQYQKVNKERSSSRYKFFKGEITVG